MRLGFFSSIVLALGIIGGGYFLGEGIAHRNDAERITSVKGLSEKEVPASLSIWDLSISAQAGTLDELRNKLSADIKKVSEFLHSQGFEDQEFFIQPPDVKDNYRNADFMANRSRAQKKFELLQRGQEDSSSTIEAIQAILNIPRYEANQSIVIRSSKVGKIKPAMASLIQLLGEGIEVSSSRPQFIYEKLNDIKPEMIAEATRNSRIAAENFAKDSHSRLGGLVRASQGWFNVSDRDAATPEIKVVRVIVDVDYEVD